MSVRKAYHTQATAPFLCVDNPSFKTAQVGSVKDPANQRFRQRTRFPEDNQVAEHKFVMPRPQINRFIRLTPTDTIWDHYEMHPDVIGSGAHGSVVKALCKTTGATRAVKTIWKSKSSRSNYARTQRESLVMQRLEHPNIIKSYETLEDANNVYLVMEYLKGGELFDRLRQKKRMSAAEASSVARQMLSALHYAHENNVCHRDIKLENIVYLHEEGAEEPTVKLIDWGFACKFGEHQRSGRELQFNSVVGTPFYVAPEVIKRKYDYRCDIWSLGVVVYCLLTGTPPFPGETPRAIMARIVDKDFEPIYDGCRWQGVPTEAKEFTQALLCRDIDKRISVADALNHPFITKHHRPKAVTWTELRFIQERMQRFAKKDFVNQLLTHLVVYCGYREDIESSTVMVGGRETPIKSLFEMCDPEHRGCLLPSELHQRFKEHGLTDLDDKAGTDFIDAVDSSGNGTVDFFEFVAMMLDDYTVFELTHAFDRLDTNRDGEVCSDDLFHWVGAAAVAKRKAKRAPKICIDSLREGPEPAKLALYRREFSDWFSERFGEAVGLHQILDLRAEKSEGSDSYWSDNVTVVSVSSFPMGQGMSHVSSGLAFSRELNTGRNSFAGPAPATKFRRARSEQAAVL